MRRLGGDRDRADLISWAERVCESEYGFDRERAPDQIDREGKGREGKGRKGEVYSFKAKGLAVCVPQFFV